MYYRTTSNLILCMTNLFPDALALLYRGKHSFKHPSGHTLCHTLENIKSTWCHEVCLPQFSHHTLQALNMHLETLCTTPFNLQFLLQLLFVCRSFPKTSSSRHCSFSGLPDEVVILFSDVAELCHTLCLTLIGGNFDPLDRCGILKQFCTNQGSSRLLRKHMIGRVHWKYCWSGHTIIVVEFNLLESYAAVFSVPSFCLFFCSFLCLTMSSVVPL